MAETQSSAPEPSILKSIPAAIDASLANVPPDRRGAAVVGVEWKYGLPFFKFGTAARVGENLKFAGDVETRFSKMSTSAKGYVVWTW